MKTMKILCAAILSVGLFGATASAAVTTGELAPNFTATDSKGSQHVLEDYRGKYVVMEWINHDCPFVKKHYDSGNMQTLQKKFTDKGIVWLSVNSSAEGKQGNCTPDQANDLTEQKEAFPSAVLLDPQGSLGQLYGAKTTPHMYIVDPEGTLIYQGAIDDVPSANPADVEGANNFVSLALNAAMSGTPIENSTTASYGCSVKY